MTELTALDILGFKGGYYNTDTLAYPEGVMAAGSENILYTSADGLRPFRGLAPVDPIQGGDVMVNTALGYASLSGTPGASAMGTVTLDSGGGGSVNSITVNGIEVMSGAETFDTDLPTTAANVAANITAFNSSPNYTAVAVGPVVTITSVISGTTPNGYQVVSAATTISTTDSNMTGGTTGTPAFGSIFNFINESLWFSGLGDLYHNGVDTGHNASTLLQLAPKSGGAYPAAYTVGLAQPSAPTVVAKNQGAGFSGLLTGTYSFKIARVRSATGARSIASPTSTVINCTGQTAHLTFPPLDANGQDRWAIFGTRAGFGGVGVHYLIEEIPDTGLSVINGIARSYEIEFTDADLFGIAAYIDDYPPPPCIYSAALENHVLAIGVYDNAIAVSLRNYPESYHPDHLAYLPKTPTGVLPDQLGSYIYVSTNSGVYAVSLSHSSGNPLMVQTVWSNVGIARSHNWCSAEGVIFAFVSKQGAVTMDQMAQPSTDFAVPVHKDMQDWVVERVVVLYYPALESVLYAHGEEAFMFNLNEGKWSSKIRLNNYQPGYIISGVVVDRGLKITMVNGTAYNLLDFDVNNGTDTTSYTLVSPDRVVNPAGRINILGIKGVYRHSEQSNCTFDFFTDYENNPRKTLIHESRLGMNTTERTRWWLPRKEAFRVRFSATQSDFSKDSYLSFIVVYGTLEETANIE